MPDRCEKCRRPVVWAKLPLVGVQDDGDGGQFELRNCPCGTTLARAAPSRGRAVDLEPLVQAVQRSLSPDLLEPKYRQGNRRNPLYGHCSVAAEALFYLLPRALQGSAKAARPGFRPMHGKDDAGVTHWWLQDTAGRLLDPTAAQYTSVGLRPPYERGRFCGFMSRAPGGRQEPSKRARVVMARARRLLGRGVASSLPLCETVDAGNRFATGVPVTFDYIRNMEGAPPCPRGAVDLYQQRIEPAGFYVLVDVHMRPARGWTRGELRFESPLVLRHGGRYDDESWKAALARAYGKTGKALTAAILRDGYDGIVTVDASGATSEVVALRR